MKSFLFLIICLVLLSPSKEPSPTLNFNICYTNYLAKADHYYREGKVDSAARFLAKAKEYEDLLPQDHLTAAKIYLATGSMNKLHPTLLMMVHRGYNFESLVMDDEIGRYLASRPEYKASLESSYIRKMQQIKELEVVAFIDSLFELDQANRKNNLGNDLETFNELEKGIQQCLITEILQPFGVPPIWKIGYSAHGNLFTLLMHNVTNDFGNDFDFMQVVEDAYQERKFSALEYAAILDRKASIETGYSRYALWGTSKEGRHHLGLDVQDIRNIDSVRFYSLGLGPLKYQATIHDAVLPEDYEFQNYECSIEPPPPPKSFDTINLISE